MLQGVDAGLSFLQHWPKSCLLNFSTKTGKECCYIKGISALINNK